jgi:hypothetical protein
MKELAEWFGFELARIMSASPTELGKWQNSAINKHGAEASVDIPNRQSQDPSPKKFKDCDRISQQLF